MPGLSLEKMCIELGNLQDMTVITWLQDGRFSYAAIKAHGRWYTTATERNKHIELVMSTFDLATALVSAGVEGPQVALTWRPL